MAGTKRAESKSVGFEHLNKVVLRDCIQGIRELPDDSISLVVTDPPDANPDKKYGGKSEEDYPIWMCEIMTALHPKMKPTGSVLIVIREHIDTTCAGVSPYVSNTVLAIRDLGTHGAASEWLQPGLLLWDERDVQEGMLLFSPTRILWFSPGRKPYYNLKPYLGGKRPPGAELFHAPASGIDGDVKHPVKFPPLLAKQLILTFAPPESVILDPFVGSGTTTLVAQSLGYDFIGFDSDKKYVTLANERHHSDVRYIRGSDKARAWPFQVPDSSLT